MFQSLPSHTSFGAIDAIIVIVLISLSVVIICTHEISGVVVWILRKFGAKFVPAVEIEYLTLLPLQIRGFSLTVALPAAGIRISVSWSYFAIYRRGDPTHGEDTDKLLNFYVDDFVVVAQGVSFEDICGVPPQKLREAKLKIAWTEDMIKNGYITCLAMSLVRFHCNVIDITFVLADPKDVVIHMVAAKFNCYGSWPDRGTRTIDIHVEADVGNVDVHCKDNVIAKFYSNRLELLVQLLSKKLHMSVRANFPESNFVDLSIQPFLVLFGQFQDAEDDAIEVKELHGMSSAGKMKLMEVHMPRGILTCVRDARVSVPIVMKLGGLRVSLASDKKLFEDTLIVKTITAEIESVMFRGLRSSVTGVQCEIVKTVNNTGDYLDSETMQVAVANVAITHVQPLFLAWLCVLQDTSNKLPSSRFSHPKSSTMVAAVDNFYLSVASSALFDSPVNKDMNCSRSCLPQVETCQVFSFNGMVVNKIQAARSSLSLFEIKLDVLNIEATFLALHLTNKFNISPDKSITEFTNRCGVILGFLNVVIKFELDDNLEIKQFAADVFKLSHTDSKNVRYEGNLVSADSEAAHLFGELIFLTCTDLNVICPQKEQFDIAMSSLNCTMGVMSYLRFSYGLAEIRGFVSRSVDLLAGIKAGESVPFLYNPRCKHTVDDISNSRAWLPPPPAPPPPVINKKPADAYIKVDIKSADINLIVGCDVRGDETLGPLDKATLVVRIDDFCYHDSSDTTVINWLNICCFSNRWMSEAFMVFGPTSATLIDGVSDTSSTTVVCDRLTVTMNEKMGLGNVIEAALHQRDLFQIATAEILTPPSDTLSATKAHTVDRLKVKKKIISVKFKDAFRIYFDCLFEKQDVQNFCLVEWTDQQIVLKSTGDAEADVNRVKALDEGAVNSHSRNLRYSGLNGGDLLMTSSTFRVRVAAEPDDYILATSVVYAGPFYLASVVDHRVEMLSKTVLFSDDLNVQHPNFCAELINSSAPSKVYTDLTQSYGIFSVDLHPSMSLYLDSISEVVTASIPPNSDPTPPLLWWDNYRYWMHGSMLIQMEKFKVVYTTVGAARSILNLHLFMSNAKMTVLKNIFEFKSSEFSINVEILEHVSKSRKRNNRHIQRATTMRSQLFVIPRFAMSLVHSRKPETYKQHGHHSTRFKNGGVYSHHDVYIYPSQVEPFDKFYHFRTRKWSIDWALHFHCARNSHKRGIISLFARLDVLLRVMDIFQRPAPPAAHSDIAATSSDSAVNSSSGVQGHTPPEPDVARIMDVVYSVNLFLTFDKFIACSWPSEHNLEGVVVTQDSLVLQMKQFREHDPDSFRKKILSVEREDGGDTTTPLPVNSLQIDTLRVDVGNLEIYVRDWTRATQVTTKNVRRSRYMLHSYASQLEEKFECIPSLNGLLDPIFQLAHASKLSVTLMSEDGMSFQAATKESDDKGRSRHRMSITPHMIMVHSAEPSSVSASWKHPWDEYWWGLKEIKQTQHAPAFFSSVRRSESNNTYVRYRYFMAELQHYGRQNEATKAAVQRASTGNNGGSKQHVRGKGDVLSPSSANAKQKGKLGAESQVRSEVGTSRDRCLAISDFASNHAIVHPPPSSLPSNYFFNRFPVHAVDLSELHLRKTKDGQICATKLLEKKDQNNRIWSLSVVDMRLLWTLRLRNALFGYIAHYYEILEYQKNVHSGTAPAEEKDEKKKTNIRRTSKSSAFDVKGSPAQHSDLAQLKRPPSLVEDSKTDFGDIDIGMTELARSTSISGAIDAKVTEKDSHSVLSNLFLSPLSKNNKDEADRRLKYRRAHLKRSDAKGANAKSENENEKKKREITDKDPKDSSAVCDVVSPRSRQSLSSRRMSLLFRDIQHYSFESPRSNLSPKEKGLSPSNKQSSKHRDRVMMADKSALQLLNDSELQESPIGHFNMIKELGAGEKNIDDIHSPVRDHVSGNSGEDGATDKFRTSIASRDSLADQFLTPMGKEEPSSGGIARHEHSPLPHTIATRSTAEREKYKDRQSSIELIFNRRNSYGASTSDIFDHDSTSERHTPIQNFDSATPTLSEMHISPPMRAGSAAANSPRSAYSDSAPAAAIQTEVLEPSHRRYFIVELIDPQVNFLDEKTQSSLLIVAGKSSLEGQKGTLGYVASSGADAEPKRENTLKLHMDAVSAYTISSALSRSDFPEDDAFFNGSKTVDDIVYWKTMHFTEMHQESNSMFESSVKKDKHSKYGICGSNSSASLYALDGVPKSSSLRVDKYAFEGIGVSFGGRKKVVEKLMLAIADFEIKALYTFHETVASEEAEGMRILQSDKELICLFMLDLPDVCVDITSSQFYIILNVVTNLLLAPPPKTESSWQKAETEEPADTRRNMRVLSVVAGADNLAGGGDDIGIGDNPAAAVLAAPSSDNIIGASPIQLDISNRKDREDIQRVIDNMVTLAAGQNAPTEPGLARHVEYLLGRGVWILRTDAISPMGTESVHPLGSSSSSDVEIGFMGLFGAHTFHDDRGSTSLFEVQRFWVGKDLRKGDSALSNDLPDPAIAAGDSSRVNNNKAGVSIDSGDIVAPRLYAADPCTRCGREFEVRRNTSTSCRMHMDSEGRLGVYMRYLVGKGTRCRYISKWSCCGGFDEQALGCSRRAHICKEVMVSVRAEASPAVLVDNLEVTVFNALEISVFPGAQYEICVRITRELVDILHTYFSIKDESDAEHGAVKSGEAPIDDGGPSARSLQQSALYIKYLRLGDINVEVSTNGFPVNLKGYNAVVAPLIKHGRIVDWPRLIWMLEKHAIWSVTKHTATSGISQMLKALFPSTSALPGRLGAVLDSGQPNSTDNSDENAFWNDDNDDSLRKGSDLLGFKPNKSAL